SIKKFEIDNKVEADDLVLPKLFAKLIKQRNESITQFKKADRKDLIAQEKYEIEIIQQFLPPPIEDSELQNLIQEAINKVSATSAKDIGKVLGTIKPQIIGRADMAKVSSIIKESLNS
ncbi:MAG: GatB/YqeY domain-containing protein, partial [Legionellales bacterium]|nr:GatB/YqeY domain-containing protein [Legionellales bacterium]